ncbi:low temperature requirement protein A [Amnibacterium setariae]|uniref:Low temperature requirement protein A n=1 Tax=Amnibacterium setariae TaxID=2306585 RepID=A0A3A1TUA7_9MICO|nr:low temperature requirement protein A [Amnibacterium setariae]RIX26514.1 low temperature requirement protein A [Amnibacterium setariae]
MPEVDPELRSRLRDELRHRLRPMTGRDPDQRGRSATPLELLYDLVYVIAFSAAAEQLAHRIGEGDVGPALGAYGFAVFSISWAWMSFTWFASAYGNDDALFRVATIVQMVGVVVLIFGLPVAFAAAADGRSPNNALLVAGYLVMRLPLIALWLRAARQDPAHRRSDVGYAVVVAVAQLGWVLTVVLPLPVPVVVVALVVLALAELAAPVVLERRVGRVPWNAGHIAERFSLVTLITLGEVVAATVAAVGALVEEQGWSGAAIVIAASGLVLAAGLWWAYFLIPSRPLLERDPGRTFAWRYAHLPMFGAIAAVGAGLRVAAVAVGEETHLSLLQIALALAVPVALVVLIVFATWSVLLRSADLTHVPLLALSLLPLGLALVVAAVLGGDGPLELRDAGDTAALAVVVGLVALSAVVEVVGHERVGYRHTVRALEEDGSRPA